MAANTHQKPKRRRGPGRPWPKGVSGNPDGLPPLVVKARALALAHAPRAVEKLAELLENADPRVALAAAEGLLDRAGVRPVALDAEQRGAAATGAQVVVMLAMPQRETPPAFLVGSGGVTALPARGAAMDLAPLRTPEDAPAPPRGGEAGAEGCVTTHGPLREGGRSA